jgi:hypothetical protein
MYTCEYNRVVPTYLFVKSLPFCSCLFFFLVYGFLIEVSCVSYQMNESEEGCWIGIESCNVCYVMFLRLYSIYVSIARSDLETHSL